ncbi:serine/threonine-protein kinase [Streptomyces sp. NPDC049813]|uniref:serine/threonine-protein kinase n=1 Tax=Streptomyces sp. NPDC049813 TaxID=3365597 RepID=UPI0037A3BD61
MGEVFAGRYELADPIGRGGVGAVWRAWDHRRRRYVAAKVLQQSDAHTLLRFVREQALRIDHPHVLAPASWAADDDKVLFTMDLVAGGSLAHLIGDYGPLPPPFVCVLLDQLLSGLSAVHAEGVVHRDIKPANILLEATGTGLPHLRVSDFGIAMRKGEPRLTETNYVVGTPGYFAPEQAMGAEPDFPADLFAAGLVALYLLEGAKPDARALIEHFADHGTPGAPAGVPGPLWSVLAALLQPDPEARFRTATGARRALLDAAELLPEPSADDELIEVFDQLGPLPPGFGPNGPAVRGRRARPLHATGGTGTGTPTRPAWFEGGDVGGRGRPGPGHEAWPGDGPGEDARGGPGDRAWSGEAARGGPGHPPGPASVQPAAFEPPLLPAAEPPVVPPAETPPIPTFAPPPARASEAPPVPAPHGAPPLPTSEPRTGGSEAAFSSRAEGSGGPGIGSGAGTGTEIGAEAGTGAGPGDSSGGSVGSGSGLGVSPAHPGRTADVAPPSETPPETLLTSMSETGSFHLPPPAPSPAPHPSPAGAPDPAQPATEGRPLLQPPAPPMPPSRPTPAVPLPEPPRHQPPPARTSVDPAQESVPSPADETRPAPHFPVPHDFSLSPHLSSPHPSSPHSSTPHPAHAMTTVVPQTSLDLDRHSLYTARAREVPPEAREISGRRAHHTPRTPRAPRSRRPGPPPKVTVPVLFIAMLCFALGIWALTQA